ncbi:MAG: hypothetical protein CMJ62_07570 [Planctomycetaceae bacterium]|nr:hypothetical protein [Planctomycetaceae bacterium]
MASDPHDNDAPAIHLSKSVWLSYGVLLLLSVPWYWNLFPQWAMRTFCGMPLWVSGAVIGSTLTSCYTAWLLLSRRWPDEETNCQSFPPPVEILPPGKTRDD